MKKTGVILLSLVALFGVVGAEEITYYNMDLELTKTGALREDIGFKIVGLESSKLKFPVPFEPRNLTVGGGLGFEVEEEGGGYAISILTGGQRDLEVDFGFVIEGYVQKLEEKYLFAFAHIPSLVTSNFTVRLRLPMGSGISSNNPNIPSVSPPPLGIFTDGRRIVLEWGYDELRANEAINFVVVYEFGVVDGENPGLSWLLPYIAVFAMGVLVSLSIYWFFLRPRLERIEVVKEVLSEDENQVVKAMEGADKVKQEDLRERIGYSKAKISKIVSGLEKKGVVEKERYGKTNILRLKR
jgi:hypothetical protein